MKVKKYYTQIAYSLLITSTLLTSISFSDEFSVKETRYVGPAGGWKYCTALGDVDNDGDLDLIIGVYEGQNLVYLNEGKGYYVGGTKNFGTGADKTYSVTPSDVDGDDDLDIITGNDGQNVIYLNDYSQVQSAGFGFSTGRNFGTGSDFTRAVLAADVDLDGATDIVTGNYEEQNIIYINNGAGVFSATMTIDFGTGNDKTRSLAAGQFNVADASPDIAVGNTDQNIVYFGSDFTPSENLGTGNDLTRSLVVANVDNTDGDDIIAGNNQDANVLWLNNGSGTFSESSNFWDRSHATWASATGDLNGDGEPEIVIGNEAILNDPDIVYLNNGSGVFSATTVIGSTSDWTSAIALGDVDNDGDQDIAAETLNSQLLLHMNGMIDDDGGGPIAPTVVVAATDSQNAGLADFICDGTDDEVEINQALNALGTTGGTVVLLEGTFQISDVIRMATNNCYLKGMGPGATILFRHFDNASGYEGVILCKRYTSVLEHFGISNLTVDGNKISYTYSNNIGIYCGNGVRYGTLRDLEVHSCKSTGIYVYYNAPAYMRIKNCISRNNNVHGIYLEADYSTITNCYFLENEDDGILCSGISDHITILNCCMVNNSRYGLNSGASSILLTNCQALSNYYEGYYVQGAQSSITNCLAKDNGRIGIKWTGSYSTISGCVSYSNDDDGIQGFGSWSTITGNVSSLNSDDGIYLQGCTGNIVSSNQTYNNSGKGIGMTSINECLVIGNWSDDNAEQGIDLSNCTYIKVHANDVRDNGGSGSVSAIEVERSDDCEILFNRLYDNEGTSAAIEIDDYFGIYSDRVVVAGNIISGHFATEIAKNQSIDFLEFMQPRQNDVIVASASSSAKVGFATRSQINNVITVASTAPTNPIAVSWDTYSTPDLKENIKTVSNDELQETLSTLTNVEMIEFDWKLFNKPQLEHFEDIKNPTGEIIVTAKAQYESKLAIWKDWKSNPNRNNQRSLDITDPDLPLRLKSMDENGKVNGLNQSQLLMELWCIVKQQNTRIQQLEEIIRQR